MHLLFCFILLLFSSTIIHAQKADFFKEELTFTVDTQHFTMQGDFYIARNNKNTNSIRLSFPVPENAMPHIDSFMVYDYTAEKSLPFTKSTSEFHFTVPFHGKDTVTVNIQYRQKIVSQSGKLEYIITTVQYWGKPLRYASYSLVVLDGIKTDTYSLKVDKEITVPNRSVYLWERRNFMPKTDFSFNYSFQR